ncbi:MULTISPECIES: hypothetical protein [unclassified Pseudoclavibacter]|uniref:hypothetical protein n=1 Tax=unclassified Pseudoclavibacter TaxID=2615177 RepID=UPI001BA53BEF|nr:hypothetical protein [Pseudoclavibacter sp. Marseille-Q4354]MBS3177733.1 hypothetical protein [Pseudoclavibacter sp. Marseille-Q4354]
MTKLYHFTCDDKLPSILRDGVVKPGKTGLAWFTSDPDASREQLGLTSRTLDCDRMAHWLEVSATEDVYPWGRVRSRFPRHVLDDLETTPGAEPRSWFVSKKPVPLALAGGDERA